MPTPGVYIVTMGNPCDYTREQLDRACVIAAAFNRGKFLLIEPPRNQDRQQ